MTIVIQAENLVKRYGDFTAVAGVSVEVRQGEVFGLLGPNGAGKSTLINMLTCVTPPTAGRVLIGGYDVEKQAGLVKKVVGLVPQELALYQTLTPVDNLVFFGRMAGVGGKSLRARIDEVLATVQLTDWARKPVEKFSGGMKRRLNLAVGLLHHPRILFLDEPTVGVDPQSRNHIFDCILRLVADGMTIFYTTHYMEEAQTLCNRVAIMDAGRLIALDEPRQLISAMENKTLEVGLIHCSEELLQRLRAIPGVEQVVAQEGGLHITTLDVQETVVPVLATINAAGASLTSLKTAESNLEAVFLSLTGKTLRD